MSETQKKAALESAVGEIKLTRAENGGTALLAALRKVETNPDMATVSEAIKACENARAATQWGSSPLWQTAYSVHEMLKTAQVALEEAQRDGIDDKVLKGKIETAVKAAIDYVQGDKPAPATTSIAAESEDKAKEPNSETADPNEYATLANGMKVVTNTKIIRGP
jgi:hypothetical protein